MTRKPVKRGSEGGGWKSAKHLWCLLTRWPPTLLQVRFGGEGEETRSSNDEKVRLALTLLELGTRRVHLAGVTANSRWRLGGAAGPEHGVVAG